MFSAGVGLNSLVCCPTTIPQLTKVEGEIMDIVVNGAAQEVAPATSLQQLIDFLKLGDGKIAIEVNGEIVPRSLFHQTILQQGDKLEIVQAIGGG